MKERGNIIYQEDEEFTFWVVVVWQFLSIIGIPAGIQNVMAFIEERKNERKLQSRKKQKCNYISLERYGNL
jgi:hypothetical protein